jgi:hypothetical protein
MTILKESRHSLIIVEHDSAKREGPAEEMTEYVSGPSERRLGGERG